MIGKAIRLERIMNRNRSLPKSPVLCSVPTPSLPISFNTTLLLEWQILVVGRKRTGISNSSDSGYAVSIMSCASWTFAGSRQKMPANFAYIIPAIIPATIPCNFRRIMRFGIMCFVIRTEDRDAVCGCFVLKRRDYAVLLFAGVSGTQRVPVVKILLGKDD